MAGTKPMSWKWRLTIVLVILLLVGIGFVLTEWGHGAMENAIQARYDSTPAVERRTMDSADSYLALAWWVGNICQRTKRSTEMYKKFLGIEDDSIWQKLDSGKRPWKGYFDPSDNSGWGIMHPRAPETFYEYIHQYESLGHSGQFIKDEAAKYHLLFHKLYPQIAKSKGKPHPRFYIYWEKIKDRFIMKHRGMLPTDVLPKPKDFPGPEWLGKEHELNEQ